MKNNQEQLKRLGERLGLSLYFDDNQQCLFMLDDSLFISIRANQDTWMLRGYVTEVPSNQSNIVWGEWMALNAVLAQEQAGRMVYDPDSKGLLYVEELSALIDIVDIYDKLEKFTNRLEFLTDAVS